MGKSPFVYTIDYSIRTWFSFTSVYSFLLFLTKIFDPEPKKTLTIQGIVKIIHLARLMLIYLAQAFPNAFFNFGPLMFQYMAVKDHSARPNGLDDLIWALHWTSYWW